MSRTGPVSRVLMGAQGKVGLIDANVGLGLAVAGKPIVDETNDATVVIMVIVAILVTPPPFTWSRAMVRKLRAS